MCGEPEEINVALSMTVGRQLKEGRKLPLLLAHYIETDYMGIIKTD